MKTVKHPETWKDDFLRQSMRTSFSLSLSQSMIEFLSAVSQDCHWDRAFKVRDLHKPDNWFATETSLERRGLIRRKSREQIEATKLRFKSEFPDLCDCADGPAFCELTPAGEHVVALFKTVGLFVETESAINRRKSKRG